jgi:hypothetical protein
MHESKVGMPFKEAAFHAHYGCGAALHGRRGCLAKGRRHRRTRSPDPVIGMLSLRINEPDLPWPPFPEQADRFLSKLVGLAPLAGETTVSPAK